MSSSSDSSDDSDSSGQTSDSRSTISLPASQAGTPRAQPASAKKAKVCQPILSIMDAPGVESMSQPAHHEGRRNTRVEHLGVSKADRDLDALSELVDIECLSSLEGSMGVSCQKGGEVQPPLSMSTF